MSRHLAVFAYRDEERDGRFKRLARQRQTQLKVRVFKKKIGFSGIIRAAVSSLPPKSVAVSGLIKKARVCLRRASFYPGFSQAFSPLDEKNA